MRILHVIPTMYHDDGGPPVVVWAFASALVEQGHHVEIATCAMVGAPRSNPYVRTDGWDEEVAKINAKNK